MRGDTTIGADVWIGSEAWIMPGVTIGPGAIIGARVGSDPRRRTPTPLLPETPRASCASASTTPPSRRCSTSPGGSGPPRSITAISAPSAAPISPR
jgi:carbonic anhydrase/acetyltransferase-like protein (isoleucine patch superfamily)